MQETFVQSPNFTSGRNNIPIDRIVIHWMDGYLAGADSRFVNPASQVSAHYGVEDDIVHQYVQESDAAWHAGNFAMNLRSIGIEHSAQPERGASDLTYQNSAHLIAAISQKYNIPLDRVHVIKHNEVVPDQCPGDVSPDQLIALAQQLINTNTVAPVVPIVVVQPTPIASFPVIAWVGEVTVEDTELMVRSAPNTNASSGLGDVNPDGNLYQGNVVDIVGYVHAQDPYGDGRDIWLVTEPGNFVWAAGTDFTGGPIVLDENGGIVTITVSELMVRSGPYLSAPSGVANTPDGNLHQGDVVSYTQIVEGDSVNGNNRWYKNRFSHYFSTIGAN